MIVDQVFQITHFLNVIRVSIVMSDVQLIIAYTCAVLKNTKT